MLTYRVTPMRNSTSNRGSSSFVLAVAIAALSGPVVASPDEEGFLDAFAAATIAAAARGEPSALGSLSILLDMPSPWRDTVLAAVERSDLITELDKLHSAGSGRERRQIDALSQRVAALQGQEARTVALNVSLGEVSVDLGSEAIQWVLVAGLPNGPGELVVRTPSCTPDIVAFPSSASLPTQPVAGLVRLSAQLASIPYTGPIALRIKPGDCEDADLSLQLSHAPARVGFAMQSVDFGAAAAPLDRFPALSPDQLTLVPLGRRSAQTFSVPTQTGFVYEVYAAPLTVDLDPALLRADPTNAGDFVDASDDDGWQLGAHLGQFVGTGRAERLAVTRRNDGHGEVAVLVRREPIPELDPAAAGPTPVSVASSTWRRLRLSAGTWSVATTDVPQGLDPALTVYDGTTGAILGWNDDADEGDLAARVLLQLDQPREIIIRLVSVEGDGECIIEATAPVKPATTRDRGTPEAPPELST